MQTLDAIDGKQARRTGSSSPLGELFDHGKVMPQHWTGLQGYSNPEDTLTPPSLLSVERLLDKAENEPCGGAHCYCPGPPLPLLCVLPLLCALRVSRPVPVPRTSKYGLPCICPVWRWDAVPLSAVAALRLHWSLVACAIIPGGLRLNRL